MWRQKKYPDHEERSRVLMNELLDELVLLWTKEENPELKTVAEELEMSAAKVRKLLITAGERDKVKYYLSAAAEEVLKLHREGKSTDEICALTGLSRSSVTGYLPHSKTVYSLDMMSAEAKRIRIHRLRKAAVQDLLKHRECPDELDFLWRAVTAFENYPFQTLGRGSRHSGATKFRYTVSRKGGAGGRHYQGESISGYGNELWIEGREKSISRSTVNLAYRNALEVQRSEGFVSGPRKLGVPGSRSYLYAMFLRFGVITNG